MEMLGLSRGLTQRHIRNCFLNSIDKERGVGLKLKSKQQAQKSEDQTNVRFLGKGRPSLNPHQEARSYSDKGIEIQMIM